MKALQKISFVAIFMVLLSSLTSCGFSSMSAQTPLQMQPPQQQIGYQNPVWAPPYYPGVRYYYMPDIETYYDLSNQDFIYLDNGQWYSDYRLPPQYQGYDLYGGYVIALNVGVFEPWMHHHFYVSNYPRYYYRSLYPNYASIWGFNENISRPFLWTQGDRDRIAGYRNQGRVEERRGEIRSPRNPNYYGKNIGRPVRVQSQMREGHEGREEHGGRH
jgi:hypothetical protein